MNEHRINLGPTGRTEIVANTITKFWNKVKDIGLSKTDLDFSSISLEWFAKIKVISVSVQLLLYTETELMIIRLY